MRREIVVTGASLVIQPLPAPRGGRIPGETLITVTHKIGFEPVLMKSVALNVRELEALLQYVGERLDEARKELAA